MPGAPSGRPERKRAPRPAPPAPSVALASSAIKQVGVHEFVRRLKARLQSSKDARFVFFLGAGCSVSSGIKGAADLVREWLPELKRVTTGSSDGWEAWAAANLEDFDPDDLAAVYSEVFEKLFDTPASRQTEIERLVDRAKDPGFGYGVLAQLMVHEPLGRQANIVLTTNFDDLVADALYLYTRRKPLVVVHESLIHYAHLTRTRPMVIKLHGDARIEPYNTEDELSQLRPEVQDALKALLTEMGIVFLGYGAHDQSVLGALQGLSPTALRQGVYWVGASLPKSEMLGWLERHQATWVRHQDFDELMAHVSSEFQLPHPDEERFRRLIEEYRKSLGDLVKGVRAKADPAERQEGETAIQDVLARAPSWWAYALQAEALAKTDPEAADRKFREGLEALPASAELAGTYANFLCDVRKDHEAAERVYRRSLELDDRNVANHGNYANFLMEVRRDAETARKHHLRAIELDPANAVCIGNYANFLKGIGRDPEGAERWYRRGLELAPDNALIVANYAHYLHDVRGDREGAERLYRRSIELDPSGAGLENYASFLHEVVQDHDGAERMYQRALARDGASAACHGNYANFLCDVRKDHDAAERFYRQAMERDPRDAICRANYANLLTDVRNDHDGAERLYQQALELDPAYTHGMGNYATFLSHVRRSAAAEPLFRRALEMKPDDANLAGNFAGYLLARGHPDGLPMLDRAQAGAKADPLRLECGFYRYAHDPKGRERSLREAKAMVDAGIRSPGWDLDQNVERAGQDGHPEPRLLATLARVVAGEERAEALAAFPAWTAA